MIKIHIDLADASAVELAAFYEIPGMKEALGSLNTRGRELNVALTMTGGEAAVVALMNDIAAKLPPHIEYDEFHKLPGTKLHFIPGDDGVQHVVIAPSGEAKSMLGTMLQAGHPPIPDSSGH